MIHVLALIILVSAPGWSQSAPPVLQLTEKTLVEFTRMDSPQSSALTAQEEQGRFEKARLDAQYETQAKLNYHFLKSDEQGLAAFIPVMSPTRDISLGLEKRIPMGVAVGASVFGNQLNTEDGTIVRATRAGARVQMDIDLFKNIFGRLDRAQLKSQKASERRAELQAEIGRKEFEINVRKIFWALVANRDRISLARQLVKSSEQQLADMRKRFQAGAAEKGDVARNLALLESRKSSLILFEYEREQLVYQLKTFLPKLSGFELKFKAVDFEKAADDVLACADQIASRPYVDPTSSSYFEVAGLLKEQKATEQSIASTTGDIDLKFTGQLQSSGVGRGFDAAREEYMDNGKTGYGIGVILTMPLEGDARKAERHQLKLVQSGYDSQIQMAEQKVSETHRQILRSLLLLQRATNSMDRNVKNLKASLISTRRKYRQARVGLTELIFEQDNLFRSELETIQTKLTIINALYDYFKVFNKHSCKVNRI